MLVHFIRNSCHHPNPFQTVPKSCRLRSEVIVVSNARSIGYISAVVPVQMDGLAPGVQLL